jgi:hypothetical protein
MNSGFIFLNGETTNRRRRAYRKSLITNKIYFLPSRLMLPRTLAHRHLLSSNKKRAFATTARCFEKPIMNRHSRIVTQPKDQGASQVDIGELFFKVNASISYIFRLCSMLQMKSRQTMTSTRPWLVWPAYGESFLVILLLQFLITFRRYEGNP